MERRLGTGAPLRNPGKRRGYLLFRGQESSSAFRRKVNDAELVPWKK